jgi:rhamnulose-1-phosphate aldolase/alcohol dehydrogenase
MQSDDAKTFTHVRYLWRDDDAPPDELEQLIYRSNLLGADQRITNTGGGNTSAKLTESDPLNGQATEVLWVKGSGGDLRTARRENFASLYLDKLNGLIPRYLADPARGLKTAAEDRQVENYRHCTFNLNPTACSIDTPLHAFIPARHVDHTHPNAVIVLAATRRSKELTAEVFGDEVGWVPWMRPGFELGLLMQEQLRRQPNLVGMVMAQHGLINWADTSKTCYERTLSLIERAARFIEAHDKGAKTFGGQAYRSLQDAPRDKLLADLLPWLRGQLGQRGRMIATVQSDAATARFVNSHHAPRLAELGTSCPDHFLRTKIKPLYVHWNPKDGFHSLREKLTTELAQYRKDYAAYYEVHRNRSEPPNVRDPNPTVILIPGIGLIAWGKNKSESRVTAEFYNCAIEVMRGAEAIDEYIPLPAQEAFDIEYWKLEELKLRRMPLEKEFARRVAVVIGAGSGIGKQVARRIAAEGAHVVCADLSAASAQATADELITWNNAVHGPGIGVAGTGISASGPIIAAPVDITQRQSLHDLYNKATLAYGGIDHLVVTAGVFIAPEKSTARLTDDQWQQTFDVNVRGTFNAVGELKPLLATQNLPDCSIVLTTSVNAVVAKTSSLAYDTSKAAANHLVRELAIDLAPAVRVNAVAPATVVQGSTMFPRDRVIASLSKYKIAFDEKEPTEALRSKLADFYAQRTLTRLPVTAQDQAEAVYFLLSAASSKTTGQIINVDGGLHEAFLR